MNDVLNILSSLIGLIVFISIAFIGLAVTRYKRCPSNQILVVYGRVGKGKSAKCIHGGGAFIIPLIQDYKYLSLQPMTIDIPLSGALSKQNIRINTPSTFTVAISTEPEIMLNGAERLLGMSYKEIEELAEDLILGQLRLVIATLDIEEINQDREKFLKNINENVTSELTKIGLQLINVNIKDLTDESGYIVAIGKKSAAEAINKAKVEVAIQERNGSIGESKANREKEVQVAYEMSETEKGRKEAEKNQRIAIAHLEAEGISEEAKARREQEVSMAKEEAEADKGKKSADSEKRITIADMEASAVEGENVSKARVAEYNATLVEKESLAKERSRIADAKAEKAILDSERNVESSRLEKEEIVKIEIEKKKTELEAEAQAEKSRRIARGDADAIIMKYQADADGAKKLLEAKAAGYKNIIAACQNDPKMASTLLLIEKMESLVEKQVDAIKNLKIDKITVWDSGNNGGTTSNFVRNFVSSIPPLQEIVGQVGIELPSFLGSIKEEKDDNETTNEEKTSKTNKEKGKD